MWKDDRGAVVEHCSVQIANVPSAAG